jgi:hypothetical protein
VCDVGGCHAGAEQKSGSVQETVGYKNEAPAPKKNGPIVKIGCKTNQLLPPSQL